MTLPRHTTNIPENRRATAAYNFVPIAEQVVPAQAVLNEFAWYNPKLHTGIIKCTLVTRAPLYTRAALEPSEYEMNRAARDKTDFFYIDPSTKQPVIPGSSLRGMFRSLFEIITFGKLQPITDRQLVFRTLDNSSIGKAYGRRMSGGDPNQGGYYPLARAGYMELHNDTYRIRPAKEIHGTQHYRVEEQTARRVFRNLQNMSIRRQDGRYAPNPKYKWMRCPVWFKPTAPSSHLPESPTYHAEVTEISITKPTSSTGWEQGYFIASGWVPSRKGGKHRHWIIGPPTANDAACIEIDERDIAIYEEEGAGLTQKILNEGMSVLPTKEGEAIPCFYTFWEDSKGTTRVAFGHTAMFRLPYEYSPYDFLPEAHKSSTVDASEALFGWVDDTAEMQVAGRVSFSDALFLDAQSDLYLPHTDVEPIRALLSSPKPTSFQHYLVQRTTSKQGLFNYQSIGETTVRGHKVYWHKGKSLTKKDIHDPSVPEKQQTEFRPINKGVRFEFSIYFENLTGEELGALSWILQVASDEQYALKLGMGKALGLGSVSVSGSAWRDNRRKRYKHLFSTDGELSSKFHQLSVENAATNFEQYMLSALESQTEVASFSALPRIQMLLKLLEWDPSNDGRLSETMVLGSFRDRRVLPDPVTATGGVLPANYTTPQHTERSSRQNSQTIYTSETSSGSDQDVAALAARVMAALGGDGPAEESAETTAPQPTASDDAIVPTSREQIQPGVYLQGAVKRVESSRVVVDVLHEEATLTFDQIPGVDDYEDARMHFAEGKPVKAWVRRINKKGRIQLTMRKP